MVGLAFFNGQREKHSARLAWPNLKIWNAVFIDFGGKKELVRVVPQEFLITELHNGEPVVESFKECFLTFASEHMPEDKNRLALPLDTELLQRSLGGSGTGKLTGGAGSNPRHIDLTARTSDCDLNID